MTKRARVDYGPDCVVCGCKEINVGHDSPEWRVDPKNAHSHPFRDQDGLDYYTWAKVDYHPFQAPTADRLAHQHQWRCECGAVR